MEKERNPVPTNGEDAVESANEDRRCAEEQTQTEPVRSRFLDALRKFAVPYDPEDDFDVFEDFEDWEDEEIVPTGKPGEDA